MYETLYTPSFESQEYTFNVDFSEFIAYYQGLIDVWIGDGSTPVGQEYEDEHGVIKYKGGTAGYLYGKYHNGAIDEIGFVSDYEAAKEYFESHGIQMDLTYQQWIEYISSMPGWAADALTQANRAAMWAAGTSTGNGSSTNNAKYWATQAKNANTSAQSAKTDAEAAKGAALAAQAASEAARDVAQTGATSASASASAASASATQASSANTSAQSAKSDAQSANAAAQEAKNSAQSAATDAGNAKSDAETARNEARQWATGSTSGTYTSGNSAKEQANRAAVWAAGTSSGNGSSTNNAKYWAQQAANSQQSVTDQINAKLTEIANATTAASNAADRANTVAVKVEDLSATATTLDPSNAATASVTTDPSTQHYVLNLGIPQGVKGDKGEPNYLVPEVNGTNLIFNWSEDPGALSARTIYYDTRVANPITIYDKFQNIDIDAITNSQIDALFA